MIILLGPELRQDMGYISPASWLAAITIVNNNIHRLVTISCKDVSAKCHSSAIQSTTAVLPLLSFICCHTFAHAFLFDSDHFCCWLCMVSHYVFLIFTQFCLTFQSYRSSHSLCAFISISCHAMEYAEHLIVASKFQ